MRMSSVTSDSIIEWCERWTSHAVGQNTSDDVRL